MTVSRNGAEAQRTERKRGLASRRQFLTHTLALAGLPLLSSCGSAPTGTGGGRKPLIIGITTDDSGQYANDGAEERRGILLAIDEFNAKGGVLGREITSVHQDTASKPEAGALVAQRMIERDKVAFLVGSMHSGVANAISQQAQKRGVIFMNSNSSSPSESGRNAHRIKFVWDGNGFNFSAASVRYAVNAGRKKWVLLTNDYVWGHDTAKATRGFVTGLGGEVLDELLVPQGTRDFAPYLTKIQQLKPEAVGAVIGGDDLKSLRAQVTELKLDDKILWVNNQQDWPDVYGQPNSLFGIFGTNWYYKLPLPGVAELVKRYQAKFPEASIKNPGNVFFSGYMATRELLRAVERAGTTKNISVIKELENLRIPAADRLQHFDAYMNPKTHQLQQTIYLATRNDAPTEPDDIYKILGQIKPEEAEDKSAEAEAKLESYDETPVYEP